MSKKAKTKLKDKELLKQELALGKSPQEILEFKEEEMAEFYGAAYQLFQSKRYTEAANAFLFLVTLNSYNFDYWLGLGMATQMCQEYESAIDAYEMAAILNVESPVPYFYLSKCFFAVHDHENALIALDIALEFSEESDEYSDLRNQALAAKRLLKKGL
ncbi:MAG: SycD/LcrH family type III secretion system chaperone [Chlamydiota bacterium]|nr:SycD/LcrH family type III secretion system chaperone [Chlamydiota bacterium]